MISLEINQYLKEKQLKVTRARTGILTILSKSDEALTAGEIWDKLNENKIIVDLSTVYRTLETLVDKKILEKFNIDDDKYNYRFKDKGHKHKIECSVCHKIIEFDCPMPKFEEYVKLKTGVILIDSCININKGICSDCVKNKK
ncbi:MULTISPECIES: Fur family transcriptional regulator [Clostridium]|uniref:Fur family transcriptional regulator n=1 Tax=Clostridium TaxID=1485 RepID=UPI0036F35210